VSPEPPIEAIEAAVSEAQRDRLAWRAESFELLLSLMQKLDVSDPVATRAKLTEVWIEGDAVLALTAPNAYLREGNWHARKGMSGSGPLTLFVLIVVDTATLVAVRGLPPDQWPMNQT
jgi:hypothetical protein